MNPVELRPARNAIDKLLDFAPFDLEEKDKARFFGPAMSEAFRHHFENNEFVRRWCLQQGFSPEKEITDLAAYPYLPATAFKHRNLISVPAGEIRSEIRSSSTTGVPSIVSIDLITARRQSLASARVIAAYIGHHRRPFLILDEDPAVSSSREISARSAATRGFLVFADSVEYFLSRRDGLLHLDHEKLEESLAEHERKGRKICLFGFTHILYARVLKRLQEAGIFFRLPEGAKVVHIGGWKKLKDERVPKARFLEDCGRVLGVESLNVFDFYGFTEQMGLVYGGSGDSPKITPAYATLIVRDVNTLRPAKDGQAGLIQILTPLHHSYPGISVLTDDIGRIVGRGRDEAGRWGTRFEVLGRAEDAEARGCGDLMPETGTIRRAAAEGIER